MFDNLSEEQGEFLMDEFEYYCEWKDSEAREEGISLAEYENWCKLRDYGLDEDM